MPVEPSPPLPEPPRAAVPPPTLARPPDTASDNGATASEGARDLVGRARRSSGPADPHADLFGPRRRTRRLSTAAIVLGAVTVSGAAGWIWITIDANRRPGATPEVGTFVLSSQPPGARVVVDGVPAGITPLALRLTLGSHSIVATAVNGTSEQLSATVAAGESASRHLMLESSVPSAGTADASGQSVAAQTSLPGGPGAAAVAAVAPPAPAFVTFTAPFDVQIYEDGDLLGTAGDRMRVRPGAHTFTLVNHQLGFHTEQTLVVAAGRSMRRVIPQSSATLSINALPWAEVVIGQRSFGETPLANISLPIGIHAVTLRHPTLGEREVGVIVRLGRPNRLSVDLRR